MFGTVFKGLEKGLGELEIRERIKIIQIISRSARILSPKELKRLSVSQISVKNYQLKLV